MCRELDFNPNPLQLLPCNLTVFPVVFFFFSLVDIGPIEKCLTQLKTPNTLPAEREDIKSQVWNTVTDISEEHINLLL